MSSYQDALTQAQTLKANGRHTQALAIHKQWAMSSSATPVMIHNYASALGDAGHHQSAVEACERAFKAGLSAPETYLVYARSLQGVGRLKEAEAAFIKVISSRPTDAAAHRDLSQLLWMQTADKAAALDILNQTLNNYPQNIDLALTRAQLYGFMGDAEQEYKLSIEISDQHTKQADIASKAQWDVIVARAALNAGHPDKALLHAIRAESHYPDDVSVLEMGIRAHLGTGQFDQALIKAEKLTNQWPSHQYYRALFATACQLADDPRYEPLMDFKTLVKAYPLAVPKGWSTLEVYLDELIDALDEAHPYKMHPFGLSVRGGSQIASIEAMDNPALKALTQALMGPVEAYRSDVAGQLMPDHPLAQILDRQLSVLAAWSVKLPAGGHHVNHVHPQGVLSSACHLRTVQAQSNDEAKAGWLKFGEPGIDTHPALKPGYFHEPRAGVLAIFPSYMWHGTVPFKKGNRLTIAVDFR